MTYEGILSNFIYVIDRTQRFHPSSFGGSLFDYSAVRFKHSRGNLGGICDPNPVKINVVSPEVQGSLEISTNVTPFISHRPVRIEKVLPLPRDLVSSI